MDKDTTIVCTIGEAVRIFHSTQKARNDYENKCADHKVVVMEFTEEDFEQLEKSLKMGE